ncbi:MAG TPA: hypothetical protein VF789_26300 [Thermoanaerobaculia bacterium]
MTRSMKMLAAVALGLTLVAAAPAKVDDQAATKQTIIDIRAVGTAMYTWYKDQVKKPGQGGGADPVEVDISEVPVISRQDLEKLLVPKYIAHVPETDGWGNPYEFHLNVQKPDVKQGVMGLRSAGRDGVFSGETYKIGGFPLDELDQDIAWVDGYFVRWPERPKAE